jgi:hypothetical protein
VPLAVPAVPLAPSTADMVPLVPASLLVHEKVTGASPGFTVPVPAPMDVQAGWVNTAHAKTAGTPTRLIRSNRGLVLRNLLMVFSRIGCER